jgi:hypothetical protein
MASFFALLFGLGLLTMLGTVGYQLVMYLKHGHWLAISVTYVCGSPPLEWNWCNFPNDWVGVHNVLSWINAGAFAFLVGIVALSIATASEG